MTEVVSVVRAESYDYADLLRSFNHLFSVMGLDPDNPFKNIIKPGMSVFIKPNLVASRWRKSCPKVDDIYSVITHPNVVRIVAEFVDRALDGQGAITIGDNPSIDADFDELLKLTRLDEIPAKLKTKCTIIDMRPLFCDNLEYYGKKDMMVKQAGDPNGNVTVNLGKQSLLYGIDPSLFRGVFDEREETIESHTGDRQLYTYGRSLFDADVYISIPKLKTHVKTGVTLNLKGLVGSITNKNQLVHWRVGGPETGGDEYSSCSELMAAKNAKVTRRGAWPGNDTIWRMVVDLYTGLQTKDRAYISIVDGIIGGESDGPFCPDAKHSNVLIGGFNLLYTDVVCTRLMGIDPMKIRYLNHYICGDLAYYNNITVRSDFLDTKEFFNKDDLYLDFKLNEKWKSIRYEYDPSLAVKKYKIGYTTGVYDLFHIGHLNLLRRAKSMCDYLIVGVTTDELVSYKHKKAVIPFEERIQIIGSIEYVDLAVPQTSMDKMAAWDQYRFDVMFVGDDWKGSDKWNKFEEEFKNVGVDIVYFPYTKGISSTLLNETLIKLRGGTNDG